MNQTMNPNFFYGYLFISYLIASIPFGLIITKFLLKIDVRTQGSGNIGATNVFRTGSKGAAISTLLFDGLKGFVPVFLLLSQNHHSPHAFFIAGACVIGHVFPLWLKFKGGKGVATTLGVSFALYPLWGVFLLLIWIGMYGMKKISSLSALTAIGLSPVFIYFSTHQKDFTVFSIVLAVFIFWTHRDNIKRLLNHRET
jgi:glycerol-3-phosphate acyltransferase PlsY